MSQLVELRKLAEEYLGSLLVQGHSAENHTNRSFYINRFLNHLESEGRDLFDTDRKSKTCVDHGCLLRWLQANRLTGVGECSLQANKSAISGFY